MFENKVKALRTIHQNQLIKKKTLFESNSIIDDVTEHEVSVHWFVMAKLRVFLGLQKTKAAFEIRFTDRIYMITDWLKPLQKRCLYSLQQEQFVLIKYIVQYILVSDKRDSPVRNPQNLFRFAQNRSP